MTHLNYLIILWHVWYFYFKFGELRIHCLYDLLILIFYSFGFERPFFELIYLNKALLETRFEYLAFSCGNWYFGNTHLGSFWTFGALLNHFSFSYTNCLFFCPHIRIVRNHLAGCSVIPFHSCTGLFNWFIPAIAAFCVDFLWKSSVGGLEG